MKNTKRNKFNSIFSFFAILLTCCFAFVGCSKSTDTDSKDNKSEGPSQPPQMDYLGGGGTGTIPTEIDYSSYETAIVNASNLDLTTEKSNIDQTDATTLDSDGSITVAGSYLLSGDYPKGISITANKNDTIHLFLNGATISTSSSEIESSGICKSSNAINLIITVVDGTENSITSNYNSYNALHVKGNLVINGTGTLNIYANGTNASGIKVSKKCTIVDATVKINSTKHGISAEEIVSEDAKISITASTSDSKDGLHSECDFDNENGKTYDFTLEKGFVYLKNVDFTCSVYGDGIQADTFVYISGGNYNITTNGVFVKYSSENLTTYGLEDDDFRYIRSGTSYQKVADDYNGSLSNRYALVQSCKGIKVGEIEYDTDGNDVDDATVTENTNYTIYINDGNFEISSSDDAIHSNSGNTYIKNGTFTINTNDDAITSDLLSQVDGGTITVESCYEGIEGAYVKITGGNINIISSDDGINSASDDTSIKEYIIITGGEIFVDASGDGLDSNGSILITGGNVIVSGPTSNADGALDAETGIIVQGGNLIAYSSLGMVETPSQNSTQYVVSYGQNTQISSGSVVTIKNSSDEEVITFTTTKVSGSIILSSPNLQNGQSYSIYINSNQVSTFTISNIITTIGTSSNFPNGGNGGGQNPGNAPEPPRNNFSGR